MTQLEQARQNVITDQMRQVAESEKVDPEFIRSEVAQGTLVIPANIKHIATSLKPVGIGRAITTKINANTINGQVKNNNSRLTKISKPRFMASLNRLCLKPSPNTIHPG